MRSDANKPRSRKALLICLAAVLVLAAACLWYLLDHYPADAEALTVLEQPGVQQLRGSVRLDPEQDAVTGIIFYPGAKVAAEAYLPLLEAIRDECGVACVLVEMPFNMAIFDTDAAADVMADNPDITDWYIAGHSMGGAMASSYAAENPAAVEGVILLGAYPYGDYPLADTLTVYGSLNTSVAEQVDYTQNVVVIDGGNHAQFGNYGPQAGDAEAAISAEEQQSQTVEAVKAFLAG